MPISCSNIQRTQVFPIYKQQPGLLSRSHLRAFASCHAYSRATANDSTQRFRAKLKKLPHADLTPEQLRTVPLKELDPPYRVFKNRDYNRLKPGDPPRTEVLVDLDGGGITVSSVAECAIECTKTLDCNVASWYGASPSWKDVRNCWLKQLEPACQLPADAERHSDERAFLIARPRECELSPWRC